MSRSVVCLLLLASTLHAQELSLPAGVARIDSQAVVDPSLTDHRVVWSGQLAALPSDAGLAALAVEAGGWLEVLPGGLRVLHAQAAAPLSALGGPPVSASGTDVVSLARALADAAGLPLRVDPALSGACALTFDRTPALTALGVLARVAGADLWRSDRGGWQLTPRTAVTVDQVHGLHDQVAIDLAASCELDLVVDASRPVPLSLRVASRSARELLGVVAQAADVPLGRGEIWTLGVEAPPAEPAADDDARVSLRGRFTVREALWRLAQAGDRALRVGPVAAGGVRVYLEDVPCRQALAAVAAVGSLRLQAVDGQLYALPAGRTLQPLPGVVAPRWAVAQQVDPARWYALLASEAGVALEVGSTWPAPVSGRFGPSSLGEAIAWSARIHDHALVPAAAGGWRVTSPAPPPPAAPFTPLSPEALAVLSHLGRAARAGSRERALLALELLEGRVGATLAEPTQAAWSSELVALLQHLRATPASASEQLLLQLSPLLEQGGEEGERVLRRLVQRWDGRWADDAVRARVRWLTDRARGRRLLAVLREACQRRRAEDAQRALRQLTTSCDLWATDPACPPWVGDLQAQGRRTWEEHRGLLAIRGPGLRVEAALGAGGERPAVALIDGHLVHPGEPLRDEAGEPLPGLTLVAVEPEGLQLDHRGRRVRIPFDLPPR